MIICPRCATRFRTDSPICHACGGGPIASIQEDSDAPPEPPAPDFTPRISAADIRSRLSQNALIWGFISGVGLCLLIAGYATLFGDGMWFGCAIMVFVAPCAGLLGALGFSMLAESLQVLIRPLLHALDPRARSALRKIKKESEPAESGYDPMRPHARRGSQGDGVIGAALPQKEVSGIASKPQIQREPE
jgi:hypothetical protein